METKTTSQEYMQKQKQAKDIIIWKQKQQAKDIYGNKNNKPRIYVQKQKQAKGIIICKQKQQQVSDIIYMEAKTTTSQ